MVERLTAAFRLRFGATPRLFQAPGRINVIGEHTDYSEGFAMPAAIDRRCLVAAAPNGLEALRVVACNTGDEVSLDWAGLKPSGNWSDYVAGVWRVLRDAGVPIAGVDLMIDSTVPIGAGVSSSAALEVAVATALLRLADHPADGVSIARWAQTAENDFVGMPCGIMDQFASANGRAGCALMLDCRTLGAAPTSLPNGAAFLVIDSMVRHALVSGEYAERRGDCEAAAARLGLKALRDLEEADLGTALPQLSRRQARRVRHVVSENARVQRAAIAMAAGDLDGLGEIMTLSHQSLRDDMGVSVLQLDLLADVARATAGVFGARMMGGGFGGSVIALVAQEAAPEALNHIVQSYGAQIGKEPAGFICHAVDGAREVIL